MTYVLKLLVFGPNCGHSGRAHQAKAVKGAAGAWLNGAIVWPSCCLWGVLYCSRQIVSCAFALAQGRTRDLNQAPACQSGIAWMACSILASSF